MWEIKDFSHFTEIKRWYILHIIICITFFISSLLINVVQMLLFVTLRPFNKALYRSINYYLMYSMMAHVLFLAEWWSGSEIRMYTDDESHSNFGKEHAIIIMNHTYEVDWVMGWIVADRYKILGAAKVFVKNVIKYVPTFGWAWSCSDTIFLHRNWQHDKSIMENQVQEFFDYPYPVWILLFCEGTRFTHAKHETSMEVARKKGLPTLKHHLLPRSKGFVLCAQSMRDHFKYIYDVTASFDTKNGAEPTLLSMLKGHPVIGELYIRRLPTSDIPTDEAGAIDYLNKLYQTKDKLLDSYLNTGSFSRESGLEKYPLQKLPRRYFSLCNMLVWSTLICYYLLQYYYCLLTTGTLLANVIAIIVFFMAYISLHKLMGLTKIEKGSAYGEKGSTYGEKGSAYGEKGSAYGEKGSAFGEKGSAYGEKGSAYGEKGSAYGNTSPTAAKKGN